MPPDIIVTDSTASSPAIQERWLAAVLLVFAVAFNLYRLYPEVSIYVPPLNDYVLHERTLRETVETLASGGNPTDFWLSPIGLGYPLFHHYQHLAYLPPALVCWVTTSTSLPSRMEWVGGEDFGCYTVFRWSAYLLLCLFPLSIYWSTRKMGYSYLTSAFSRLVDFRRRQRPGHFRGRLVDDHAGSDKHRGIFQRRNSTGVRLLVRHANLHPQPSDSDLIAKQ